MVTKNNNSAADKTNNRPLFAARTDALVSLAEKSISDLRTVRDELDYRTAKKAQLLRDAISEILQVVQQQSEKKFFPWPTTDVPTGQGAGQILLIEDDLGVMSHYGYHVGKVKGLPRVKRRQILETIYEVQALPYRIFPPDVLDEWGLPGTKTRIQKLANFLASHAKNAKKVKDKDMTIAISDWEQDLAYIKSKYYLGKFDGLAGGFPWPET